MPQQRMSVVKIVFGLLVALAIGVAGFWLITNESSDDPDDGVGVAVSVMRWHATAPDGDSGR